MTLNIDTFIRQRDRVLLLHSGSLHIILRGCNLSLSSLYSRCVGVLSMQITIYVKLITVSSCKLINHVIYLFLRVALCWAD